ncbi:hypothetical protein HGRIS_002086 [Hohenbuehelia grisea]|uniref:Transposase n=1 Tax=Hohenbuehelia grisea TaxID=104357 RepID=A0ABR3JKG9_9AGAR
MYPTYGHGHGHGQNEKKLSYDREFSRQIGVGKRGIQSLYPGRGDNGGRPTQVVALELAYAEIDELRNGIQKIHECYKRQEPDMFNGRTPTQMEVIQRAIEEIWTSRDLLAEIHRLYAGSNPYGTTPQLPEAIEEAVHEIQDMRTTRSELEHLLQRFPNLAPHFSKVPFKRRGCKRR